MNSTFINDVFTLIEQTEIHNLIEESNKFGTYEFSDQERRVAAERIRLLGKFKKSHINARPELDVAIMAEIGNNLHIVFSRTDQSGKLIDNILKNAN